VGGTAQRRAGEPRGGEAPARAAGFYARLFAHTPEAYVVTNRAGVVLEASTAAEPTLRCRRAALVGQELDGLLAGSSREALRALLRRADEGGTHSTELLLATGNGPQVTLCATVTALTDDAEAAYALIVRDVTSEQEHVGQLASAASELEERLTERTSQLSAVLNRLPLGVVLIDGGNGQVVEYNARALELLGPGWDRVSPPRLYAVEGRTASGDVVGDDEWPSARALRGEVVLGDLLHMRMADGEEHLLEISAAPVAEADGRVLSAVVVFQDVADRERREHAIRAFVTNAAHELGTPLAGIIAAVEALQAGAKDDAEHRDRFIHHIERESARLERLMRALLVLARSQARAEAASLEIVPLAPLIAEVARAVDPRPGVRVETTCADDVAAIANRSLLEQALANLAGNAARYTAAGVIRLTAEKRNGDVLLVVSDTGPGIPEEVRERLFERFARGEGQVAGFGLGLSIARDSVEATGGSLEVESSAEHGTRAVVRLAGARLVDGA
jgi:PAS domain S-box-containing protein